MDSKQPETTTSLRTLDADAVAAILGCSTRKARGLMRAGAIVSRRVGRSWRCLPDAVVDYMKEQKP
jgi:hypothetical protein